MKDEIRRCTFSARLDCHYLLDVPEGADSESALIVALHGFGQDAETMQHLTRKMLGPRHVIAAMQGPYQFFLDGQATKVGYGWNTNRDAPNSIRLHHDMVQHVLNESGRECGIPNERRLLAGFSQPVSLNYRFSATFPDSVRGVIGICGGLPGDWETGAYHPVTASVLHIARRQDEYYPPSVTEQYPERLRLRVLDVEFHLIDGGHRFPSHGGAIVESWLKRVLR